MKVQVLSWAQNKKSRESGFLFEILLSLCSPFEFANKREHVIKPATKLAFVVAYVRYADRAVFCVDKFDEAFDVCSDECHHHTAAIIMLSQEKIVATRDFSTTKNGLIRLEFPKDEVFSNWHNLLFS